MKSYLSTTLGLVCVVLVIILVVIKSGDNTQHEKDDGAIADYSNQLDSAQMQLSLSTGTVVLFSNQLDQCQSAALTFSNQLNGAESNLTLDAGQITNLTQQIAVMESQNQTLNQSLVDLTNQMTRQVDDLTGKLTLTETNLAQANKNYALLENRFRRDVAERVVVERKYNNYLDLKERLQEIEQHPAGAVSDESIYAGLDVEVESNGSFHVISPD